MNSPRPFGTRAVCVAGAATLLTLSAVFTGCSHRYSADGTSLEGTGAASQLLAASPVDGDRAFRRGQLFYPLAVGNHWDWRIHVVNQITTDAGPQPPDTTEQPWAAEIVSTAQLGTREYFIQSEYDPRVDLQPPSTGFPLRENRLGLFERDVPAGPLMTAEGEAAADPVASGLAAYVERSVADPARRLAYARAAMEVAQKVSVIQLGAGLRRRPLTGADPGELTMLSYPLRVGASWIVRDSPRFTRVVVGQDLIRVPLGTFTAWKLRGLSELFGANDRVHYWYSPLGLVRLRYHIEADAVDNTGAVIGRVATDADQSLTAFRRGDTPVYPALVAAPGEPR